MKVNGFVKPGNRPWDYNSSMQNKREALYYIGLSLGVLLMVSLPYALAASSAGQDTSFGGFLLNPGDGNSYLAKMYQGWEGSWKFHLPYTAEAEGKSFFFIYYLFLGQAARYLGLPLILVFHVARLLGSLAMLAALASFFQSVSPTAGQARLAFAIAALGSGLGWFLVPFGGFSTDFWVAETYPFLSAYANPHFPLGIALMLTLLATNQERQSPQQARWRREILLGVLAGLVLSLVLPFGVVLVLLVLGGLLLVETWRLLRSELAGEDHFSLKEIWREAHRLDLPQLVRSWTFYRLLGVFLGGVPLLFYYLWAISRDALLAGWNAQNLTPSPPPWDLLISLSPVLWLAIAGLGVAWRQGKSGGRLLALWGVLGVALIYMPVSLQRRFMLGLYIPLAGLASFGAWRLCEWKPRRAAWLVATLFLLSLPTNWLVLAAGIHGIQTRDPALYLSGDEQVLMDWLVERTPAEAVILAAPETGLLIPAYSGRRVLYGHPFESFPAGVRRDQVIDFYRGTAENGEAGLLQQVDYVVYGPRERALGTPASLSGLKSVFTSENMQVYGADTGGGP